MPDDTPPIRLLTFALAAIAAQLPERGPLDRARPEESFLRGHLEAVTGDERAWPDSLEDHLRQPAAEDRPLLWLQDELKLTRLEVLAIALADGVERDLLVGRAVARAQAPLGGSRPTVGLLGRALASVSTGSAVDELLSGRAVRSGMLALAGDGPLPERAVYLPAALALALSGQDGAWPGATIGLGDFPPVPLPNSMRLEAARHAAGLQAAPGRGLVIRTGSPAEGRSTALLVAEVLRRRAVFLEPEPTAGLGPWLILRNLLPVFVVDPAPGERKLLPALPLYDGPLLALCGPDGSVESAGGTVLSWRLPVPTREERALLWEQAIGRGDLAPELARDHRHSAGRIAHLGRLAHHHARLSGRDRPTREDLAAVAWVAEGPGLDALAQPLPDRIDDQALVLTPALARDLYLLLERCRTRDRLAQGLGASSVARYHPGVRALFVGPSGTGKTLAAGWLATRLGLPLYRVDLASVTSKYIGETEKNLAQLLAQAEQAEVVLLFDEADSLFGKRTDVRDSHDRFANAQTNYLLQRIESFDGITLLTSNSRGRFDDGFSRRLDVIVDFPTPSPEDRRALWESHLGQVDGQPRLEIRQLNQLALATELTGGHIRTAVLAASVLARSAGRPLSYRDVLQGMAAEYQKLGRPLPQELAHDLPPAPVERRALWQAALGPEHALEPRELTRLAAIAALDPAHIERTARQALERSRADGLRGNRARYRDVLDALHEVYDELGERVPRELIEG